MKIVYNVRHKTGFISYVAHLIKQTIANALSFKVGPIKTDIESCFIVGCGHTGTTLMAATLGKHDEVLAIGKETSRFLPIYGLQTSKAVVEEWLYFCGVLNKGVLVEKTPKHVHVANRLCRVLPRAKFVVMVRNPLDTCASLFKRFNDIEYCIERYNMDHGAALELSNQKNSLLVRYEDFASNPEKVMKQVCSFLDIEYSKNIIRPSETIYSTSNELGVLELRKQQIEKEIVFRKDPHKKVFSGADIEKIVKRTAKVSKYFGY